MKQIPFNAELIGKPGIEVKYRNGEKPDFVKNYVADERLISIDSHGCRYSHFSNGHNGIASDTPYDLFMYRQQRTAEEIAREVFQIEKRENGYVADWEDLHPDTKSRYIALVQAGMDEMSGE